MDKESKLRKKWKWAEKLGVIFGAGLSIIIISALIFDIIARLLSITTPISQGNIDILTGIAGTVLSLALVGIYYRMSQTQSEMSKFEKTQTEIQESQIGIEKAQLELQKTQTEIARTGSLPHISFDELRYTGTGSKFKIGLSNLGNSAARDLRLQIQPDLLNWSGEALQEVQKDEWQIGHEDILLTRPLNDEDNTQKEVFVTAQGDYLDSERTNEMYEFEMLFTGMYNGSFNHTLDRIRPSQLLKTAICETTVEENHEHFDDFKRFTGFEHHLQETAYDNGKDYSEETWAKLAGDIGFNRLRLSFILKYSSEGGKNHEEELTELIVPLSVALEREEMWEFAQPVSEYEARLGDRGFNMGMDPIEEAIRQESCVEDLQ